MLMCRLLSHLDGFGDRHLSLLGHPYALARTALKYEFNMLVLNNVIGKVLDVGCGFTPYRYLFSNAEEYHGLEIDQPRNRNNPNVTHLYNGGTFPLEKNVYSAVICSQVLEHSFDPRLLLSEIYRVLLPGGRLYLSIPFIWQEHEQPFDSQRFTSFGLKYQLESVGFQCITMHKTNPGISAFLQLLIEWLESQKRAHIPRRFHRLWKIGMILPYTALNLMGFCYRNFSSVKRGANSSEFYLDLVITATKP